MTLTVLIMALTFGCGKSQEEKDQAALNAATKAICECYEKNKSDWLMTNEQCPPMADVAKSVFTKEEHKKQIDAKVLECDKYHKDVQKAPVK